MNINNFRIFAHRGLWDNESEENSIEAIERSFFNGYDVETDLRIVDEKFIISHDLPKLNDPLLHLDELLNMLKEYPKRKLALHFKYDDWRSPKALNVIKFLKPFNQQVFLFDMSLNFCETMKKTDDSIVVGVSVGDKHYHDGFTNIEDAINSNIDIIWADEYRKFYSPQLFETCKKSKKKVYCISPDLAQGVGHPKAINGLDGVLLNLIEWGADGVCTDKPRKVRKVYADYCASSG